MINELFSDAVVIHHYEKLFILSPGIAYDFYSCTGLFLALFLMGKSVFTKFLPRSLVTHFKYPHSTAPIFNVRIIFHKQSVMEKF